MKRRLDPDAFVAGKLAWHERLTKDPGLSLPAKAVAGLILHDLNASEGGAWRGQTSMAAVLGVSDRQLRRLLNELQQAGYLTVAVRRGRGRTKICVAALPGDAQDANEKRSSAADLTSEKRTLMSAQPPENRTSASQKADADVRQYHYESIRRSSAASGGASGGPSSRATFANPEIRNWVVALAGEGAAKSYLDPSTWDAKRKRIVCATSTGAARLLERAGSHLAAEGISVALPERRALDQRMAA